MIKGKALYSQIFFNHQPLMAFLSYWIQKITQPISIYHLVIYHRKFILYFSLAMDFLMIFRFQRKGIAFVFFYEATKYYLMGNFFLPEALIAYLLAFNFGLLLESLWGKTLSQIDFLIASGFTFAVVFLGLPYIPIAILLYGLMLVSTKKNSLKQKSFSIIIFLLLSTITLISLPLKDYLFDLLIVNNQFITSEVQRTGVTGLGLAKIFFYPLLIFLTGRPSFFRGILIGLAIVFFILLFFQILRRKKTKEILLLIFLMGLAAIRFVPPGTVFYEAFHLLSWYAIFLVVIFYWMFELSGQKKFKKIFSLLAIFITIFWIYCFFSPKSFLMEKADLQSEFTVNFAPYYSYGTVIKILAKSGDTLFLDQWDDLIYWASTLDSSFEYSLYTPAMIKFDKFNQARLKMFEVNPPNFYYSYYGASENCSPLFPEKYKNDYLQLFFSNKPTCLYIKRTKLAETSESQWEEVKKLGFGLPNTTK